MKLLSPGLARCRDYIDTPYTYLANRNTWIQSVRLVAAAFRSRDEKKLS